MRILRWTVAITLATAMTAGAAQANWRDVRLETKKTAHGIAWAELGSGEPLLLLNGTSSPMSEWDPLLLESLAAHARVIVFDYPGLGASRIAAPRTFEAMAASTSQFLTDIGVPKADVVGWSMGGFIAQEMMRNHAQQLDRVVLMSTNPGGSRAVLGPEWVQRADSDPNAGLGTYVRTNYPKTECAKAAGWRFINRVIKAQNSGRFPRSRIPSATNRAMVNAEDPWLRSNRNLQQLRSVDLPTLVVVGRDDVITPAKNSQALLDAIPGARGVFVEGAGHSVAFQAPHTMAQVITDFTDGRPVPRRISSGCTP